VIRKKYAHPVCKKMRDIRRAAGISLMDVEQRFGVSSVLLGSYERGDRNPPLSKIEEILNSYGYTLDAVPVDEKAVRLPENMAAELRIIADQLEGINAVPQVSVTPAYRA